MKKLIYLLLIGTVLISCNRKKEILTFKNFSTDSNGSIISMEIENDKKIKTSSFTSDDWGIYKYRMDGLVGRLVKVNINSDTTIDYIPLLSFKDVKKLPIVEELEDGEMISQTIKRNEMGGFKLAKFLNLSITNEYCLQYMEKDIKNVFIEDHDFDLKLVHKYFSRQDEKFDIKDYKIINGVVLQQITFKEYNNRQRKIDAEDIPVNTSILVSGGYAYSSGNEKYKLKYRVIPNFIEANAIKERADLLYEKK